MAYSGRAEQIFHRALLRAFDRVTLEQFVVESLDIELENVTRRGNFSDEVWDLVRWADRNDRLKELIEKAGEVSANPHLREAVKQVRDPELLEDRWFARFVPLTTWLIRVVNVLLLVALVKVWMVNLIDITRLLLGVTLVTVLLYLGWMLYQRLIGGPVRTLAGILLLRRLVAHSRLSRRDWYAFGATLVVAVALGALVRAAPRPLRVSFGWEGVTSVWRDLEFDVVKSFPTSSTLELQGPDRAGLTQRDRFSRTHYRVDIFAAPRNAAREVTVQIELVPPGARDLNDELAKLPPGVTFADVAFDRALASVLSDRVVESEAGPRLFVFDRSIKFTLHLEQLKGSHTVLFTCQRSTDAQPNPSEVAVYAQLSDASDGSILAATKSTFSLDDWERGVGAGRSMVGRALQPAPGRARRADAAVITIAGALLRLPFRRTFPV
jgi:hypothetical protein